MIDTVHKEGMRHHRESDDAYLAKIRSANPKVTGLFNEKQITYKPKQPQERGGFVCEKCTKAGDNVIYSYYLTMKKGEWPLLPSNASVLLGAARKCEEDGGKQVGRWHTHPGSLFPEEKNKTSKLKDKPKVKEYHYYWNAGGTFSTGETENSSADNPLFVITRSRITSSPWTYVTNMSTGGPGRQVRESEQKPPEWVELGDIEP